MPVPSVISDLSTTPSLNSPAGSDNLSTTDDYLRAIQAIIRTTNSKGGDIASATTTDIGAATGEFVDVTGATTITGLGTIAAGIVRTVRFTGALTLTHNATSLILPSGANITTANGDVAQFRSLGSGNWQCVCYMKASGTPTLGANTFTGLQSFAVHAGSITAASTIDLTAATGNTIYINGSATITSFTMNAGQQFELLMSSSYNLTYNATTMNINGGVSYAGSLYDRLSVRKIGSVVYVNVIKQDGTALVNPAASTTASGIVELATSAEAIAGTDAVRAITPSTLFGGLNASGSAPIYACRAWVNFNGTGTPAINASGNVASITDNGVGLYTVNFTTAMPDANYSVQVTSSAGLLGNLNEGAELGTSKLAGSVQVRTGTRSTNTAVDHANISVSVFR